MIKPDVSIIVPIYGVEKYLDRCVNSIRNQSFGSIEIILVDDESPDKCPSMCDEYAKEDERIKVIHKKNEGLGYARNSGLEIATGEYVYFVDSDDYIALDAVELLYGHAVRHQLDMCFGNIFMQDENGKITENHSPFEGEILNSEGIKNKVLKGMLGAAPNEKVDSNVRMSAWQGLYRRNWLEEYHLRFPSEREFISEDIIFHLRALPLASSMGYIKECVLYHIVDNPESLTHKFNPKRFEKCGILYLEEKRILKNIDKSGTMLIRAQRMYLGNVRVCLKQLVAQEESKGEDFVKRNIRLIANDKILQDVLGTYPYWKNPIRQSIFSFFLKFKLYGAVYYATKLFVNR